MVLGPLCSEEVLHRLGIQPSENGALSGTAILGGKGDNRVDFTSVKKHSS